MKRFFAFFSAVFFPICLFAASVREPMSLEEKVGQLLIVHFRGSEVNDDAKILVQEVNVGGIIYYNWANDLSAPEQVFKLSEGLQDLCRAKHLPIPLFISADQEGGVVNRLTKGFTIFPGNRALGVTGNPELARMAAEAMAQEMLAVGVNLVYAPVVDVSSNRGNPIGLRAYGETPELVTVFGRAALEGYHKAGVITSLKHFPGHGDVAMDSHDSLPVIDKSLERLKREDLVPFFELASQADTIMLGHLMVPALDKENCAPLSKEVIDFLRSETGYNRVVMTDSMVMKGLIANSGSVDEAAVRALKAGCDILLLGGSHLTEGLKSELSVEDVRRIHGYVVKAVREGIISEKRIDEAVGRVLELKRSYGLSLHKKKKLSEISNVVATSEHRALASRIAFEALKVQINKPLIADLKESSILLCAPEMMKDSISAAQLDLLNSRQNSFYFKDLEPTVAESTQALEMARQSDVTLFYCYNAWKNQQQAALIESLIENSKAVILVVLRDSFDAELFSKVDLLYITHSPTQPSLEAVVENLKNHQVKPN